jgi:hypothetical protein
MSKQTAVEWLVEKLSNYDSKMIELFDNEIKIAKDIERTQLIDAFENREEILFMKEYFKQTYNK